ncbi:MAG TPA: ABC transporter substrate binding protein [Pyrinomonadaceae bacterium]|nr:ABC transporter substrate binding protein [Pyrinomonadaceae bacterium]
MLRRPIKMNLALALGKVLACLLITTLYLLSAQAASADELPKKVLIFSSDSHFVPGNMLLDQAVSSTVRRGSPEGVQFFYEALDTFRIPTDKYEEEMVRLLQRRYSGESIDLIYAFNRSALKFLLKHRGELFSNTPVVFISYEMKRVADLSLDAQVTGVGGKVELSPTLDIALALQPQTKRVVVVAGKMPADNAFVEQARQEFTPYEGKVEFVYLIGLSIEEVQTKLASLPDKSIVFYLWVSSDSTPQISANPELISLLAPSSSAPIYGTSQTYMGNGMIGGRLVDFEALGTRAGEMGLRILAGESPQNIPLQTIPNTTMFDWRELHRWGIDEAKLPPGSIVRYKEFSVWELYKWRIIGAIALIVLEALGIVWLLFTQAKRRQAERRSSRFALLAEAEHQHLDEIVANVPGIVWEARVEAGDPIPKTTFVSPYLGKMLGYSAGEWLSKPSFWLSTIVDEDREQAKKTFTRVLESGEDGISQIRYWTKDGRVLWAEAHLTAIRDENGTPVGLRGVTMNISDRRQAESALQENQAQLAAIIGSAMDAIISIDDRQRVVLFNAAAESMFGCSANEALGQPFNTFIPKPFRDTQDHFSALKQTNGGGPQIGSFASFYGKRAGGEDFPVDLSISEVELNGARFYTIILRDITERMRAEEALRESEHRFQLVSQATKDILYEWNLQTDFVWWNDSAMGSVFGYPLEEMRHDLNWWEERIHPEDKARIDVSVSEALGGVEQMWENEYRFRKMDSSYAYVYHRAFIVRDEGGKALKVIGSLMDFSERKQSEEKLRSALGEVSQLKNQLQEENIYLQEEIKLAHDYDQIVGRSDATKYVLFKIEQVAPTDTTVLITGETGTGKELVAHAIHGGSSRRDRPLVKVNCAALSPTLIESELFGHEKGAFTGASARKIGRFELANGATIFLDEIGELPLELQAKLLRVIQENEFERLGSSKTIKVDSRIIAATNRNLKTAVEQGAFRSDLWYRLNVFPITVPPLRDRKEDIPGLVEHFVKRFSQKVGRRISSIPPASMRILQDYAWPGNVRELANVLERAVINTTGSVLRVVDHFEKAQVAEPSQTNKTLEEMEKEYIIRILDHTGWRIEGHKGAARVLGLNPSTLRTRMAKLGIQRRETNILTSSLS